MDKRTTGIVATLVTAFTCGFPGLICLCTGAMFALISFIPNAKIDIGGSHEPSAALTFGVIVFIVGIVSIAIPVILAIVTWRKRKSTQSISFNEPIPPAN